MMKRLFSTSDVHLRDRLDYWHSIACQNLIANDSQPECRQTFQAELHAGAMAGLNGTVALTSAV